MCGCKTKKTPLGKGVFDLQGLDFFDGKSGLYGNCIQRDSGITKPLGHGLFLFQSLGFGFSFSLGSSFFLAFMKVKFVSHVLVPYESVGFVIGHLVVDGYGFAGIRILGREILHVSLHDRIGKFLVPSKYIKVFKSKIVQSDISVFLSPVFEVVNMKSVAENIHRAKENDVLLPKTSVKIPLGECHAIADALVIPGSLRKFLGIDHLHLQVEGAERFPVFVRLPRVNIVTDSLVLGVIAQNSLGVRAFQMFDLNAEQMLDKRLCDVLVAKNKPEHNRIGNVEVVERFDIHDSSFASNAMTKCIKENRKKRATSLFCKQLLTKKCILQTGVDMDSCSRKTERIAEVPCYREAA